MLIMLSLLGLFIGLRAVLAAMASLRHLPRNNEDWIWY